MVANVRMGVERWGWVTQESVRLRELHRAVKASLEAHRDRALKMGAGIMRAQARLGPGLTLTACIDAGLKPRVAQTYRQVAEAFADEQGRFDPERARRHPAFAGRSMEEIASLSYSALRRAVQKPREFRSPDSRMTTVQYRAHVDRLVDELGRALAYGMIEVAKRIQQDLKGLGPRGTVEAVRAVAPSNTPPEAGRADDDRDPLMMSEEEVGERLAVLEGKDPASLSDRERRRLRQLRALCPGRAPVVGEAVFDGEPYCPGGDDDGELEGLDDQDEGDDDGELEGLDDQDEGDDDDGR